MPTATTYPVGTVLIHRDDNPNHPDARRLVRRAVDPAEWPWVRLTGLPGAVPRQYSDLSDWTPQHLYHLAAVLRHPTVEATW